MALSVAQGTVLAKTGTIGAVATTGLGFTPSLLILYATAQTAEGFLDGSSLSFGAATDATTQQRAIAVAADDAVATSNTGRSAAQKVITILSNGTPTVVAEAELDSFDADGFTLDWTTVHATNAYLVHYLALGGADLTNVKVGEFVLPITTDVNYEVTDPGFQPDSVLLFGIASEVALGTATFASFGIGAATSATARWASTYRNRDAVTTTEISTYQRSTLCYASLSVAGAVRTEADLVGFTATGFDLNVSTAPPAADRVFYIAMKGAQFAAGVDTLNTSLGTKKTTLAFQPSAVLLSTIGQVAAATPYTAAVAGRPALGSGTSSTARGAISAGSGDGLTTTNEASATLTTKILRVMSPAVTIASEADLASLDADGFTLDTTTAGAAHEFGYLAIGAAPAGGTTSRNLSLLGIG